MKNIRPTFSEADRSKTAALIDPIVTELINLSLQSKQMHWVVIGPTFSEFHAFLDEIADKYREYSDEFAERMLALGVTPNGQVGDVAAGSKLAPLPKGFIQVSDGVTMMADRVAAVTVRVRDAREQTGPLDTTTEDMLIELAGVLEKQLWMLQAMES